MMTTMNTFHQLNPSTNSAKDENTIQLQIPLQSAGDIVSWLIEQSIPFGVHFPKTPLSARPTIKDETQTFLPSAEKITKSAFEINTAQKTQEKCISDVFDNYITNGLTQIPPTQEAIAAELNISLPTFKARFRALYGKTFYQVYMDKKMEYAAKLLKQGYRANKVSVMVGYGEKSCIKFNKMFQKYFRVTPKKYQMSHIHQSKASI
jgi:AraC-like DNA-binding protein